MMSIRIGCSKGLARSATRIARGGNVRAVQAGVLLFLAIALLLLPSVRSSAQQRISGRVITADSVPVWNAAVRLRPMDSSGTQLSTQTDAQGRFTFQFTSADESDAALEDFLLGQNYPNPFSGTTTIPFELRSSSHVRLDISDMLGRRVRHLLDDMRASGRYVATWDGRDDHGVALPTGVYLLQMQDRARLQVRKILHGASSPNAVGGDRDEGSTLHELSKSVAGRRFELDALDTSLAQPRFFSLRRMQFSSEGDTSLTVVVYDSSRWRFMGLGGEYIYRLYLHDSTLYACLKKNGLARTVVDRTDSSWLILPGPSSSNGDVKDILVDEMNPNKLIITCQTISAQLTYVFSSSDRGATWMPSDSGLYNIVNGVRIFPIIERIKYAYGKVIGIGSVTCISTDFGGSWTRIMNAASSNIPVQFEQHDSIKYILCFGGMGFAQAPVFGYSLDTGATWHRIFDFGPNIRKAGSISALGIIPDLQLWIYAFFEEGIFRSKDFGISWDGPLPHSDGIIHSIVRAKDVLWTGGRELSCSYDGGISWRTMNTPLPRGTDIHQLLLVPNEDLFFIASSNGVYKIRL